MKIDYVTLFCFVDDFVRALSLGIKSSLFLMERSNVIVGVICFYRKLWPFWFPTINLEWPALNTFIFLYFRITIPYFLGLSIMIGSWSWSKKRFLRLSVCSKVWQEKSQNIFLSIQHLWPCVTLYEKKNTRRSKGWQQKEKPQQDGSSDSSSTWFSTRKEKLSFWPLHLEMWETEHLSSIWWKTLQLNGLYLKRPLCQIIPTRIHDHH